MNQSTRYVVEMERPTPRTESMWFVVDAQSSDRAVVYRCWRSGEAERYATDLNGWGCARDTADVGFRPDGGDMGGANADDYAEGCDV